MLLHGIGVFVVESMSPANRTRQRNRQAQGLSRSYGQHPCPTGLMLLLRQCFKEVSHKDSPERHGRAAPRLRPAEGASVNKTENIGIGFLFMHLALEKSFALPSSCPLVYTSGFTLVPVQFHKPQEGIEPPTYRCFCVLAYEAIALPD
jgi:hypothetical protein